MSYPVITDHFRCQVLMKSSTGLAADTCVNNWYFRNDDAGLGIGTFAGAVKAILDEFYDGTDGGAASALSSLLSNEIVETEYVMYDLGAPAPRYPVAREMGSWAGGSSSKLPRETACVLSFYSGVGPRARGRIYVGPLSENAGTVQNGFLRPSPILRNILTAQAENVRNSSQNATWVTVSPTAGTSGVVRGGWVDDAFDTQRSRGVPASLRDTWGLPKV